MKLSSTRILEDLKAVLKDLSPVGPDPAYWVFSEVSKGKWANITVWAPGKHGDEYNKTFGHYHPENAVDETYHVIEGRGILQLQKRDLSEVFLIKAQAGDEIIIPWEYGHSWSNIGNGPLMTFDNWTSGHTPADYEPIEKLHGLAYYLIEANGEVKAVPNSNYKDLPEPIWFSAEEFAQRGK